MRVRVTLSGSISKGSSRASALRPSMVVRYLRSGRDSLFDKDQSVDTRLCYTFFEPPQTVPILKPLSNSRTKRNTALVMLLVWLFALTSGVANACLLQASESYNHGLPVAHSSAAAAVPEISADHVEAFTCPEAGPGTLQASCLKACDNGTQALPKQQSVFDPPDPGLALFVALVWTATAVVVSAPNRVGALQPPVPQLPVRVRFSRLAL